MNVDQVSKQIHLISAGDWVYHPKLGNGVVMQVQISMVLVHWKQTNQLSRVKKTELVKVGG